MTQIVSKPDYGSSIGTTTDGKSVVLSEEHQTFFDDLEANLNTNLLGDVVIMQAYTVATVPTAADFTNGVIIVTDETGGRTLATSDGTNWRRVSDGAIIS